MAARSSMRCWTGRTIHDRRPRPRHQPPNDPVAAPVLASLKQLRAKTIHWNPRELPNDCAFRRQGGAIDGWLLVDEEPIRLGSIGGVFNRMSSVELTPNSTSCRRKTHFANTPSARHRR